MILQTVVTPLCSKVKTLAPLFNSTSIAKLPSELRSTLIPFIKRGKAISDVPVITVFEVVTVESKETGEVITSPVSCSDDICWLKAEEK